FGSKHKAFHGSSSYEIQKSYKEQPKFIEGTRKLVDYNGETINELFQKLEEGLRSSLSYLNAYNISEYQNHAHFCVK
ncbi:hypothetical protein, partial [Streptococcus pneumoniae]|uniref:hypothetical protein n=1 Tax=Streptococcus pneumoniae TaxID=1313 RepID=UPI001E48BB0E